MKSEPFIWGDTLSREYVLMIFDYYYKKLNINFNFHIADGYYETNDYELGGKKYFRGYCIDILSNLYKPCNSKLLKQKNKINIK